MEHIKSPNPISREPGKQYVFLAGSIEMGQAENWQDKVVSALVDTEWTIWNPRRDNWDSSWEQSIENPQFVEQVEWELTGQTQADKILMYFDPQTKSPISLLELGLFARDNKLIVVCPNGFWRKGNVDIVCRQFNIPLFTDLSDATQLLLKGKD